VTQTDYSLLARFIVRILSIYVALRAGWGLLGSLVAMFRADLLSPDFTVLILLPVIFYVICLDAAYRAWHVRSAKFVRRLCFVAAVFSYNFFLVWAILAYNIPGLSLLIRNIDHAGTANLALGLAAAMLLSLAEMFFYQRLVRLHLTLLNLIEDRSPKERVLSVGLSIALIAYVSMRLLPWRSPSHHAHPALKTDGQTSASAQ
jgi:hypothetical protein